METPTVCRICGSLEGPWYACVDDLAPWTSFCAGCNRNRGPGSSPTALWAPTCSGCSTPVRFCWPLKQIEDVLSPTGDFVPHCKRCRAYTLISRMHDAPASETSWQPIAHAMVAAASVQSQLIVNGLRTEATGVTNDMLSLRVKAAEEESLRHTTLRRQDRERREELEAQVQELVGSLTIRRLCHERLAEICADKHNRLAAAGLASASPSGAGAAAASGAAPAPASSASGEAGAPVLVGSGEAGARGAPEPAAEPSAELFSPGSPADRSRSPRR